SYRYAAHLAHGQGLVYNPGERVEGYTNFLWILTLATGVLLGGDPVRLGTVLGGIASALTVLATYRLARSLTGRAGRTPAESRFVAPAAAFFLAVSPAMGVYGFCGLETPLFTLLAVIAVDLALASKGTLRDDLYFVIVLFLATLTRPEGALLFGILAFAALGRSGGVSRPGRWLRPALLYSVPVALYLLWKLDYFGTIVPNVA